MDRLLAHFANLALLCNYSTLKSMGSCKEAQSSPNGLKIRPYANLLTGSTGCAAGVTNHLGRCPRLLQFQPFGLLSLMRMRQVDA